MGAGPCERWLSDRQSAAKYPDHRRRRTERRQGQQQEGRSGAGFDYWHREQPAATAGATAAAAGSGYLWTGASEVAGHWVRGLRRFRRDWLVSS
jgi:hypothetical protein